MLVDEGQGVFVTLALHAGLSLAPSQHLHGDQIPSVVRLGQAGPGMAAALRVHHGSEGPQGPLQSSQI